ncbi:MAG: rhomboid family intramembrane serine protease [candidate division Zixibacteria bacterium]|nr:rhomboid family intramembrane serine protease [candidate division Zixibacteria bacterium]
MRGFWKNQPRGNFSFGQQRGLPVGVKYLLISNVVIYLLQQIIGSELVKFGGLTPVRVLQDLAIYQFITYMFLHGGFWHIAMNMFVLWMFGREIEAMWGLKKFLKYYFLCGIAGGIFTVMFLPNSYVPTIGASGAIYGLLVAYAVMFPNRTIYLYFLFPVKVKWAVIVFVGLAFLASFNAGSSNIGHLAHLGGAVVGFIYLKLDWRLRNLFYRLSPLRMWRDRRNRKNTRKMEKNRGKAEEVMKRVDAILDKINEVGIENISEEERRFLGSASDILSKKDK